MRKCLIFFVVLLCSSCSSDHGQPIATLSYEGVSITPSGYGYKISFTSDTDLLALLGDSIGDGLVCALEDDLDFSIGHYLKRSGRGSVRYVNDSTGGHYDSTVIFRKSEDSQGQESILGKKELRNVLAVRDFVVCTYRVNNSEHRTYFSKLMRVPTKDFLNEIDK